MAKRWRIHSHDSGHIAALQRAAGVPAVVAQLLICRGIHDPASARAFLAPRLSELRDPDLLPGCAAAAEHVHRFAQSGRRIMIYGDYDVDGMTGTALLWQCLKLLGATASYYIPHRVDEGYGLSGEAIASRTFDDVGLMITVDCGIGNVQEVALATERGIDVIVTDHHEPGPVLPEARAIVHPRLAGSDYPFGGLSGSGVALKLAWALCQQASGAKKVGTQMKEFLLKAVGLAALGTVADVVPLVDENRVLVHHGLTSLAQQPTLGLSHLIKTANLHEKPQFDAEDLAFQLAPRLNAAGRLGQPQLAVELLVTQRHERAQELAQYIEQLNSQRQTLDRSIYLAAHKQAKQQLEAADEPALVLADRGWHPGVIGIVAGRLAEKYHRPVVLISWDTMGVRPGIGSARGVPGVNLHAALAACDEYLLSHGGHVAAAGLKIEEGQFEGFRAAFCEVLSAEASAAGNTPELLIDAEAPFSAFTLQAVEQIERLAPFGHCNARPLLCATGVTLAEPPRPIGGGHHLSLRLCQHDVTFRAVAFGGGDWAEQLTALDHPIDVAFRPVINAFRGRRSVELHLVDWK